MSLHGVPGGSTGGGGGSPSGDAGGDLQGTYPNPSLADTIGGDHTFTGTITVDGDIGAANVSAGNGNFFSVNIPDPSGASITAAGGLLTLQSGYGYQADFVTGQTGYGAAFAFGDTYAVQIPQALWMGTSGDRTTPAGYVNFHFTGTNLQVDANVVPFFNPPYAANNLLMEDGAGNISDVSGFTASGGTITGGTFSGTFSGDGSALTNITGANIPSLNDGSGGYVYQAQVLKGAAGPSLWGQVSSDNIWKPNTDEKVASNNESNYIDNSGFHGDGSALTGLPDPFDQDLNTGSRPEFAGINLTASIQLNGDDGTTGMVIESLDSADPQWTNVLHASNGLAALDFSNRILIALDGTTNVIAWDPADTNVNSAAYWFDSANSNRIIGDGSGLTGITATNATYLYDTGGPTLSVDGNLRLLVAPDTANILDWSGTNDHFSAYYFDSGHLLTGSGAGLTDIHAPIADALFGNEFGNFGIDFDSPQMWKPENDIPIGSENKSNYVDNSGFHGDGSALTGIVAAGLDDGAGHTLSYDGSVDQTFVTDSGTGLRSKGSFYVGESGSPSIVIDVDGTSVRSFRTEGGSAIVYGASSTVWIGDIDGGPVMTVKFGDGVKLDDTIYASSGNWGIDLTGLAEFTSIKQSIDPSVWAINSDGSGALSSGTINWDGSGDFTAAKLSSDGGLFSTDGAGNLTAATLTAGNGATDSFITVDGKTVTVTNGIVTSITGP